MRLSAGTKLGPYEILSLIGAGGMGEVYRARDARLNRIVAIKVIPDGRVSSTGSQARFKREARAVAQISHPNICMLFDVGLHDDMDYLVMEFLEGETLGARLNGEPLPIKEVLALGGEVADALNAAHAAGVIHRDIKPGNLFITRHGHVKVLDFGLAKLERERVATASATTIGATQLTSDGATVGTLSYMSPEQVYGRDVDARSDLFSFGVVLYEMATGRLPFRGESAGVIFDAILHRVPVPPIRLNPDLPPALEAIINKALEKDPDLRYQHASDMQSDLKRLQRDTTRGAGSGTNAGALGNYRPAGTSQAPDNTEKPDSTAKPNRRHGRVLSATAAAMVLIAALAYLFRPALPPPSVSDYIQLTHDGARKYLIGTDGPRLYFVRRGGQPVQMSATGGNEAPVNISLPGTKLYRLSSISPDGSKLLIAQLSGLSDAGGPMWSVPTLGGSPIRLEDIEGISGAWSPDGQKLIYYRGNALYLANADGAESRPLTSLPGPIEGPNTDTSEGQNITTSPVWSPDGRAIALTLVTPKAQINQLWEVSADGKKLHTMFPGWQSQRSACCGSWTSDGKYFIFASQGQLWAARQAGSLLNKVARQPVQLTSGVVSYNYPVPGKDGKTIFATAGIRRGELERYNASKRQFEPILGGISAQDVAFSKDEEWVAYVSYPDGALWRSRVDGSDKTQLSFPPVYVLDPRWSPDGTEIVFFGLEKGRTARMYEVSASGGAPQPLMPSGSGDQVDPVWSPDGDRLVFGGLSSSAHAIQILDLKTHQVSKVAGSDGMFSPRWSPDGRYLLALPADESGLMLFDFKTQKWTMVFKGLAFYPCWSHDGRSAYFLHISSPDSVVERVAVPSGKVEEVVSLKGFPFTGFYTFWFGLGPDDSPLLLKDTGAEEIVSMKWTSP